MENRILTTLMDKLAQLIEKNVQNCFQRLSPSTYNNRIRIRIGKYILGAVIIRKEVESIRWAEALVQVQTYEGSPIST